MCVLCCHTICNNSSDCFESLAVSSVVYYLKMFTGITFYVVNLHVSYICACCCYCMELTPYPLLLSHQTCGTKPAIYLSIVQQTFQNHLLLNLFLHTWQTTKYMGKNLNSASLRILYFGVQHLSRSEC